MTFLMVVCSLKHF